jgi:hypothetical protein
MLVVILLLILVSSFEEMKQVDLFEMVLRDQNDQYQEFQYHLIMKVHDQSLCDFVSVQVNVGVLFVFLASLKSVQHYQESNSLH